MMKHLHASVLKRTGMILGLVLMGGAVWQFGLRPSNAEAAQVVLPYDKAENVARGAELYAENCAVCHGAKLEGAPNWRQRDADGLLPAPPHDSSGHTWHHPDAILFAITKFGTEQVVGQGYQSNMPGFGDGLSDQDILDVLGYIKSTWPSRVIDTHNQINGS
ncbi:cytochrome c [Shimia sp. R11_0]|uniref:c-type cytochrome n=1 Tax=Shimia sp. R11_0 TaxID=2821096 RepID=UPI001FFDFCBF|nr:cytochrome c [Shimia sp. R11_0]